MRAHVVMAAAAVGALVGLPVPWWLAASGCIGTLALALAGRLGGRRGGVWAVVVMFLVTSASALHATRSLDFPAADEFDGWVTLVDDPRTSGPVGVRVTVRADRRRLVASAHGAVAGRLDDALAGERVRLVGTIRPVAADDERSIQRHIVGRITVTAVLDAADAAPVAAGANAIRRTLAGGAASLTRDDRSLFLGMVMGDDRGQGPVVADDFRAAGLGHLLVVSGQNVAFVLAVAMPVAGRMRPAGRATLLMVVLGLFAVMTRFEPSVLRATAMAGVGIGSTALGRPTDGRAGLSWAVAGLLVIDPFLVHSIAFRLSAAATAGIVWLGGPLGERLPGPGWLRVPIATTVAAQLAVSPVLIAVFGPIPLASLPANVLAGPASGAVMIWGCTAGLVAGVFGGVVATVVHWPTQALLWWISSVARGAAAAPSARLGGPELIALSMAALAAVGVRRYRVGVLSGLVSVVVCASAAFATPRLPIGSTVLGNGVTVVHGQGGTVVVLDDPGPARLVLERLRLAGVRRPVLVIATDGDRADADAVLALTERFGPLPIAAPPLHRVPGARTVTAGRVLVAGTIRVVILESDPEIVFSAGSA
ncbi:MAG: ComEC/Rec2 family competence protein [Acidimicrobiales bacterium]